jgi:hypothetical protein
MCVGTYQIHTTKLYFTLQGQLQDLPQQTQILTGRRLIYVSDYGTLNFSALLTFPEHCIEVLSLVPLKKKSQNSV